MRLGRPTRLERRIHKQIVQQHAQAYMAERGFRPMTHEEIAAARARDAEVSRCDVCGRRASHEYTPPLHPGRLLLCNDCNPTHSPLLGPTS